MPYLNPSMPETLVERIIEEFHRKYFSSPEQQPLPPQRSGVTVASGELPPLPSTGLLDILDFLLGLESKKKPPQKGGGASAGMGGWGYM